MKEKNLKEIGKVMGFYSKINVAAIELNDKLNVGDTILIKGHTTNFEQKIASMQIEHEKVEKAKKGDQIGIKVVDRVRLHDKLYLK